MPELPEVETTRRGIAPQLIGRIIRSVVVRETRLRYPVSKSLSRNLSGQSVGEVSRRGKYLLLCCDTGTLIIHLGMSGSLRLVAASTQSAAHDHVDIIFDSGLCLRYHDPRRFGAMVWTAEDPSCHKLLKNLGPEPLSSLFHHDYLYSRSRGRKVKVKQFLMNSHVVVGVGNIYANEALFMAGIHPRRAVGRISKARYHGLVDAIKQVLSKAIDAGGTTLRDFVDDKGRPGYFSQQLNVYGRQDKPCCVCNKSIVHIQLASRATYYCPRCQR